VALEGEDVLAGPKDRLDRLADRREVKAVVGLVFAGRPGDRGVQLAGGCGEVAPRIAFVADDDLPAGALGAGQELDPDLSLVALGRSEGERPRRAIGREEPLDRLGQASPSLVETRLLWQLGEEIAELPAGDREEAAVGGNAHDRLGDAEVAISASVIRRRAFPGFSGRRSSAVQ
jgi:hypothetical protein